MKKLKFLTLAAIAAATAMVSSCSDNGDLSTPTKEAEGKGTEAHDQEAEPRD